MSEDREVWITYPGLYGRYEVSTHGNVREVRTKREIIPHTGRNGHLYVKLADKNLTKTYSLRYIVARSFLGRIKTGMRVVLKTRNKKNCRLENIDVIKTRGQKLE